MDFKYIYIMTFEINPEYIRQLPTQTQISIPPDKIPVLKEYILEGIRVQSGWCSEDGYVIKTSDIVVQHPMKIQHGTGCLLVQVSHTRHLFLPKLGMHLRCTIIDIFDEGIFLTYFKLKLLVARRDIPTATIRGHTVKFGDKVYTIGSHIPACITKIRYTGNEYQCLCTIDADRDVL